TILDPVAPLPCSYEPWPADGRIQTHHVELLLPRFADDDERHRTIRRTGRSQPHIAHPRDLWAVTPGPIVGLLQVTPLDLAPVWQREDIGTFPFYKEGALVRHSYVAHELRITKPTIRRDPFKHHPQQRALLRMSIFTRKDIGDQAVGGFIDHE